MAGAVVGRLISKRNGRNPRGTGGADPSDPEVAFNKRPETGAGSLVEVSGGVLPGKRVGVLGADGSVDAPAGAMQQGMLRNEFDSRKKFALKKASLGSKAPNKNEASANAPAKAPEKATTGLASNVFFGETKNKANTAKRVLLGAK